MIDKDFEVINKLVQLKLKGLDTKLTYHSLEHTLDMLAQAVRIAHDEGIGEKEIYLLKIAALYHDSGFLRTYAGHENKSCEIFLDDIHQFDFSEADIELILGLIMATKVPQMPKTHLQQIICDADLDYLGRSDFSKISNDLKNEFLHYGIVADEQAWHNLQLKFLESHHYHTKSSQQLREPEKRIHIAKLK